MRITHAHRGRAAHAAVGLLFAVALFGGAAPARAAWPAKVFAPYSYLGAGDNPPITRVADACGQTYFTLAFIVADDQGRPKWHGRAAPGLDGYADEVAALRKRGGDVLVSFGGADGTELAIAERDPAKLLAAYGAVVDRYQLTWLDFDIEGKAMADVAANARRNDALAALQAKRPGLRVSYTLPVDPNGLGDKSRQILADAKARGVAVYSANVMTMYFGPRFSAGKKLADVSIASATKAYEQCQSIDPAVRVGLTPMIGENRQMSETFTLEDAERLTRWAAATPWVCSTGFWAVHRDDAQRTHVTQEPWAFSRAFQALTNTAPAPAAAIPAAGKVAVAAPPDNVPPAGFDALFDGKDFANWTVPEGDNGHWKVVDGLIDYDAQSESAGDKCLWTRREYKNFVLRIDWRLKDAPYINKNVPYILPDGTHAKDVRGKELKMSLPDADSGVYLRGDGFYQVNIWCWPIGSGEMYSVRTDPKTPADVRAAVTPRHQADKPVGEWNRFEITAKGKDVKVDLNGVTVVDAAGIPTLPAAGRLALQHHGGKNADGTWMGPPSLVQFKNIYVRELPE